MKNRKKTKIDLNEIEELALQGKEVNQYFTKGKKISPSKDVQRVNVDFSSSMLTQLDSLASELNISRQAVIKSLLMHAIDQHKLATQGQKLK